MGAINALAVEKLISAVLALLLVWRLDWRSVSVPIIVLGQGHFLAAYYYQARAGKINLSYLGWSALLLLGYWLYPSPSALTALATIYFAVHMSVDEFYLTRLPLQLGQSPMHWGRWLEMTPLIATYAAAVSDAVLAGGAYPQFPKLIGYSLYFSGLAYLAYFLLITTGYRPDWRSCYFLLAGAALDVAAKVGWLELVPAPKLSGLIILFHYFCWYIHYYLSLPDRTRKNQYLLRVLSINGLVFALYLGLGTRGPGWIFFQEQNFYLWTLLHLITSTRTADFQGLLRRPP